MRSKNPGKAPTASSTGPVSGTDAMHSLGTGIGHLLRMTLALTENGRRVDIAGLDREVGLLCAKTLDLPHEEGRTLRPMLIDLLSDLDALFSALRGQTETQP